LATFQKKLREPAVAYTCYIPVRGVANDGLPSTVGTVRLVRMNASHRRRLVSPDGIQIPAAEIASRRGALKQMMADDGQPMAVVKVQARDSDAAHHIALSKTKQVVDVLNFFADMIPYNHGWVYFPGDAASETTVSPTIRADGDLSLASAWVGPLQPVSLRRLRATALLRPGFRRTNALLRDTARSPLDEVLLTSLEWAGRASVEPVRHQAFLLFIIALETIMMPEQAQGALKYRLQLRTAHFLGRTAKARQELFKEVGDLYKARGKIAHNGSAAVKEEDLGRLRLIVKGCVLKALVHPQVRGPNEPRDFAMWLDSRALR
jgi:Apea-like HEPN